MSKVEISQFNADELWKSGKFYLILISSNYGKETMIQVCITKLNEE